MREALEAQEHKSGKVENQPPGNEGMDTLHNWTNDQLRPVASEEFLPKEAAIYIREAVNDLARICHDMAVEKGFHEDHHNVVGLLMSYGGDGTLDWFEAMTEQAEIGRMHSELSEWLESVRASGALIPDNHLPEYLSQEIEAADCIIRILDTCSKRGYRIGEALIAKIRYNSLRPHKHGKNS